MNEFDWKDAPQWAMGVGYSLDHKEWQWFDNYHYMSTHGEKVYSFNNRNTMNNMVNILYKPTVPDWENKPDWADVWIDTGDSSAGWFKEGPDYFRDGWGCRYGKEMSERYEVHYPPEKTKQCVDELPEAGTICHMFIDGQMVGDQVLIMAYSDNLIWASVQNWDDEGNYSEVPRTYYMNEGVFTFSPIKSDKEKWVDEVQSYFNFTVGCIAPNDTHLECLYEAIVCGHISLPKELDE